MRLRCPACRKEIVVSEGEPKPKEFPFCSDRCRMVDLGQWLNEEYCVPGELASVKGTEEDDEEA